MVKFIWGNPLAFFFLKKKKKKVACKNSYGGNPLATTKHAGSHLKAVSPALHHVTSHKHTKYKNTKNSNAKIQTYVNTKILKHKYLKQAGSQASDCTAEAWTGNLLRLYGKIHMWEMTKTKTKTKTK